MRRSLTVTVAAVVLAGMALAACGGVGESDSTLEKRQAHAEKAARGEVKADPADKAAAQRPGRSAPDRDQGREPAGPGDSERESDQRSALSPQQAREVALIRDLVYELVDGLNAPDPSICTRLFSQHLLERKDRAPIVAQCERQTAEARSDLKLRRIEAIDIRRGDGAPGPLVQFVLKTDGGQVRFLFRLTRAGGAYRVDGFLPVRQPK